MEGLSYLTLDADVKDDFVEDEPALKAMFDLAKVYLLSLFPHSSDSINISQPCTVPSQKELLPQPLSTPTSILLCSRDFLGLPPSCPSP